MIVRIVHENVFNQLNILFGKVPAFLTSILIVEKSVCILRVKLLWQREASAVLSTVKIFNCRANWLFSSL